MEHYDETSNEKKKKFDKKKEKNYVRWCFEIEWQVKDEEAIEVLDMCKTTYGEELSFNTEICCDSIV